MSRHLLGLLADAAAGFATTLGLAFGPGIAHTTSMRVASLVTGFCLYFFLRWGRRWVAAGDAR